eukprot:COSAG04_NODE_13094_length_620_cov_1.301344_1_plen_32_part_01
MPAQVAYVGAEVPPPRSALVGKHHSRTPTHLR